MKKFINKKSIKKAAAFLAAFAVIAAASLLIFIQKTEAAETLPAPVITSVSNTDTGISITWGKVSGAAQYRIFRKSETEKSWTKIGTITGTSFTDKNVQGGKEYIYTVRCLSADSKSYTSSFNSGVPTVFVAPPVLKAIKLVSGGINISWNPSAGAEMYRVFKRVPGGSWKKVGNTAGTSYTDNTAEYGVTYEYTVRCIKPDLSAYTSGFDRTGLSACNVEKVVLGNASNTSSGIEITWNSAKGAYQYRVYRKLNDGADSWHLLSKTTSTKYLDSTAAAGVSYVYTVKAVAADKVTNGLYDSNGLKVTYLVMPKLTLSNVNGAVQIKYSLPSGSTKFMLMKKEEGGAWKTVTELTGTSYKDKNVSSGKTYYYSVKAAGKDGVTDDFNEAGTPIVYLKMPVVSSVDAGKTGITVKWAAVTGADKYYVYRHLKTQSGGWVKIGTTSGTSFTDTTFKKNTEYTYTVKAVTGSYTSDFKASEQSACVSGIVIAVDAGHDSSHGGAATNGLREEVINLKIAQALRDELLTYDGVVVIMTHDSLTCPVNGASNASDLLKRVQIAADHDADYLISCHNDYASASGCMMLIQNSNYRPDLHTISKGLGTAISAQLRLLGLNDRGFWARNIDDGSTYPDGSAADYYAILRHAKTMGIPAIIVEHAVMNNDYDYSKVLSSDAKLKSLGIADATGIAKYLGLEKK